MKNIVLNEVTHIDDNLSGLWQLLPCPNEQLFKLWNDEYQQAIYTLNKDSVISHGDLTEGNVIWQDANTLWIIDWETAGWIHPQIELLNVAINWGGVVLGPIRENIFKAVLQSYQSMGRQIAITPQILQAGLGSWLAWLVFKIQANLAGDQTATAHILETLRVTKQLTQEFAQLLQWVSETHHAI